MQSRFTVKVDRRPWKEVKTFAKSGRTDAHYIAETNGTTTTIMFGEGVHGAKLPSGSNVEATYRTGSGKTRVTVVYRVAAAPTPDETLWVAIRNRTNVISFQRDRRCTN